MRVTVGKKLGLGFAIVLALMIGSTALAYVKASEIQEIQDRITNLRVPTVLANITLQRDLTQLANKARQTVLSATDQQSFRSAKAVFDKQWDLITEDLARLDEIAPHWTVQANRDRLATIKVQIKEFQEEQEVGVNMAGSGVQDAMVKGGNILSQQATTTNLAVKKLLQEMIDSQVALMRTDQQRLNAGTRTLIWTLLISTFIALAVAVSVATYLSRSVSSAMGAALGSAEAIAAGNLTSADLVVASRDELGDLSAALNRMQAKLRGLIVSIGENASRIATAGEEFSAVSQQITANSEETSAQANVVSSATDEINRNLQTVAASTEEMTASISEIAKNAGEASRVAGQAMKAATDTDATVTKLGESSAEIGQVIKVITAIAQQTNLLALNATIEAARAGEAGKGFAVVANEVKGLAKQTAKATEDISLRIAAIQADAQSAVAAIKAISGIIGQVNDISATIATAVEEQSATTSEMSRNVSEAAKGSAQVTQNINGVAQAAQNTSSGATESQRAAQQLAHMSTELRELVAQFKY